MTHTPLLNLRLVHIFFNFHILECSTRGTIGHLGGTKSARLWKTVKITNINTTVNQICALCNLLKEKKVKEQGEMRDWASGHFSLFSLSEGKCGGEGHRETKHTAHKQHSWRNHWNIALCFLWTVIGPGAFFPFPLSLFLRVSLSSSCSFSARVLQQRGAF